MSQHVYLFTEDAAEVYQKVGYKEQQTTGMAELSASGYATTPDDSRLCRCRCLWIGDKLSF